ncbi:MFS transporter [Lentibacillus sediminis]|uniref:MFS transporter n=1 Tax=Lentibacillus sediminis TaxID=1940529 RepID=UPI000C1C44E6|nr:MFS transporter [Lentibacillus sediminis]
MKFLMINRNFLSMWTSNFISILNGRFRELIIPLIVLGLTGSPLVTGLVALSQQLGAVLFAIPVGTWLEKKNKKKVATVCHFLYGLGTFLLAFFITQDKVHPAIIAFILFILGVIALITRTAFSTMVPRVAGREKLLEAHTSLEASDAISTLIGPAIGGILLASAGAGITMALCGFLSIFSMIFIFIVKYREDKSISAKETGAIKKKVSNFFSESTEGVGYLFANPSQLICTLVMCSLGFSTVFIVLTVLFHARISLNFSEEYIGIILSSAGVGNIVGIFLMRWLKETNWLLTLVILLLVSSLGVLTMLMANGLLIICLGMMLFDGALSMAFVVQGAVHQGITPDEYLSRVRSATYVISGIFSMLGTFLAGVIPEFLSGKFALGFGVAMLALPAVYIIKFRKQGVKLNQIEPIYMNKRKA